jgi:hypothetical protein
MGGEGMNIRNEDIKQILLEIPGGHKHIRLKITLQDATELVFQEAAVANITRAYITVKTHPQKRSVKLKGQQLSDKKAGYADWQLLEE